ncbi:MAG: cation diffusion facilitator family transporter [Promethearchaeota archaeon]
MQKQKKQRTLIIIYISLLLNFFLFLVKYIIAMRINSISMKADSWHTLSDSFTSIVVLIGIIFSLKKPDEEHPFGHGRAELIASVIIITILAIVGFEFLKKSVERIINPSPLRFSFTGIMFFSFTAIIKEILAQISIWVGKKYNYKSLVADGWHHRSDAITTLLIIVGIFFYKKFIYIDAIMGIIISFFILSIAFRLVKESFSALIGEKPLPEIEEKLEKIIKNFYNTSLELHHLHMHKYGEHYELTFHIRLPGRMSLSKVHNISTVLEKEIKEKLNMNATIHIEPFELKRGK